MRDISRRSASCRSDPTTIFLWSEDPYRDNSPPRGSSPPRFPRGHHIARRITSSRTFGRATFAAMSFCTAKIPARNSEVANKFAAGFSSKRWSTAAFSVQRSPPRKRRREISHSGTNAIACAVAIKPSGASRPVEITPQHTHPFRCNMTRQKFGDLRSPILLFFIAQRSEPSRGFAFSVGRVRRNRYGCWGFAPKNVLRRRGAP